MAYVGNSPISVAFLTDTFSGTGSQTAFTMTVAPANTSSILVAVTGVVQDPSTYSVSGTTLTFSAAPPSGTSNISVRYLGIPASGVTTTAYRTVTDTTATAGQTSFTIPSYTVGYVDVFRNGVRLAAADFTATTGTTVVLNNACTAGDTVVTESFYVSSVLNAIPATAGSVSDSYIASVSASKLTGSRTIPKGTMPTGAVLQVVNTDYQTETSLTSTTYTEITGLNTAITPTSSSSKVLITGTLQVGHSSTTGGAIRLYRDGTLIGRDPFKWFYFGANNDVGGTLAWSFLDAPATTSSVTYKVYWRCDNATPIYLNRTSANTTIEKGSSQITLMEIAA